jgi:hypothetical protein
MSVAVYSIEYIFKNIEGDPIEYKANILAVSPDDAIDQIKRVVMKNINIRTVSNIINVHDISEAVRQGIIDRAPRKFEPMEIGKEVVYLDPYSGKEFKTAGALKAQLTRMLKEKSDFKFEEEETE